MPKGAFIRGSEYRSDARPVTEVYLSSYYIDKYPVSFRRYSECVDAGLCPPPGDEVALAGLSDPALQDTPIFYVTFDEAQTFCTADGRRLLTEAEWEKAARGPVPRMNEYTWEGNEFRCDLYYIRSCGYTPSSTQILDPLDALPGVRSHYGVELMIGGGTQFVSDWYDADYYEDAASLVDPQGPATGEWHVSKGSARRNAIELSAMIAERAPPFTTSLRCGRDAPVR